MTTMTSVQRMLTKAKLRLRSWVPYLTHVFSMMRTVETTEVPTMAVDQANRLYCNQEFMESLSTMEVAYALLHEVMHVVLSHCKRFRSACPQWTERERYTWNLAGDLVIQQLLAKHYSVSEPSGIIRIDGVIPGTKTKFLSVPGLVHGMTVEQYYGLLLQYVPEQPQPDEGNPLDPANAGSNSDGVPRDYEKGVTEIEYAMADHVLREAHKKIEKAESVRRGSVPGELVQSLRVRLCPQPDPFEELKRVVSRSVASPLGAEEFTYRRLSRRQQPDAARKRGVVRYAPECSIIIDTSGSMSGTETKAMTAIAQGLRKVQRPRVVAYDYVCQSAQRISHVSQFEFRGYGGTNMAAAVVEEDQQQRPDAIVLVTDGETGWPTTRPRAKLIVALVKGKRDGVPSWATVIDLTKEVQSYAG
jgi:predicted metal-dependent peptidase